jgi:hypothetical protein
MEEAMPKAKQKRKKRQPDIPLREFIRVWQLASNFNEVVEAFPQYHPASLRGRGIDLRKKGVCLKRFVRNEGHDWDELAKYADQCLVGEVCRGCS